MDDEPNGGGVTEGEIRLPRRQERSRKRRARSAPRPPALAKRSAALDLALLGVAALGVVRAARRPLATFARALLELELASAMGAPARISR